MTVLTSNLSFKHKNVTDMTSLDMAHTCNKFILRLALTYL